MSEDKHEFKVRTHCAECVFKIKEGDIQTGCMLNKLERFQERNDPVELNEETGTYIIKRFCQFCRNADWANRQKEPPERAVKKETEIKLAFVLVDNSDQRTYEESVEMLSLKMDDINRQDIPPTEIVLVMNNQAVRKQMSEYIKNLDKFPNLKIIDVFEEGASFERCVDVGVSKLEKSSFYCPQSIYNVFLPSDTTYKVHKFLNIDLEQFLVIKDKANIYPDIISVAAHASLGGNAGEFLDKKLEFYQKESKQEKSMIKAWDYEVTTS